MRTMCVGRLRVCVRARVYICFFNLFRAEDGVAAQVCARATFIGPILARHVEPTTCWHGHVVAHTDRKITSFFEVDSLRDKSETATRWAAENVVLTFISHLQSFSLNHFFFVRVWCRKIISKDLYATQIGQMYSLHWQHIQHFAKKIKNT